MNIRIVALSAAGLLAAAGYALAQSADVGAEDMAPPPPPHGFPADGPGGPGFGPGPGPGGPRHGRGGPHGPPPEIRAEMLKRFDANGDGVLDQSEREAAHAAMKARFEAERAEVIKRFDADGDGKLSPAERETMVTTLRAEGKEGLLRAMHEAHERRIMHERALAEFDTNKDGVLDDAEKAAMRETLKARAEQRRAAFLKEFDTNGDGTLDKAEREAAHAAMAQRHRSGEAWHAIGIGPGDPVTPAAVERAAELVRNNDPRGDFNGDGKVDQADLAEVMRKASR